MKRIEKNPIYSTPVHPLRPSFSTERTCNATGIKRAAHRGAITYYLDELEIEYQGNDIHYRHPIGDVALHTKMVQAETQASHWELYYTLRDRLGSVVTLTDSSGAIVEHRSYDPFGKPRRGDFADASNPTLQAAILEDPHAGSGAPKTPRGFTDHEHMDDQELIHMNGRVYDYNLARFLSVDPFIQEPGNSQSLNPYSYILNNPLSGTDPSGYMYRNPTTPARPSPGEDAPLVNVVSACFATACTENHIKTDGITVNKSNGADTKQTHVAKTSLSAQKTAPASGPAGPAGSKMGDESKQITTDQNEEPRKVTAKDERERMKNAGIAKGKLTKKQKAEISAVTESDEFQKVAMPVYAAAVASKSETEAIYVYRTTTEDRTVSYRFDVVKGTPCGNNSTTCMRTANPIDGLDLTFKWHPHPYGGLPSASDYINSAKLGAPSVIWRSKSFSKTRYQQIEFIGNCADSSKGICQ